MSTTDRLASRYQTLLTTASSSDDVVADHDEAALVRREVAAQPGDRVGVEVVGRLVEQQDAAAVLAGVAEQDPGQLDAAALAAGQGADGLAEDPVGQARGWRRSGPPRPRRRTRRARRTGPPARRTGGPAARRRGRRRAAPRATVISAMQRVQAARGQHPVAGGDVEVAGARVLRQVADGAGPVDLAGVRLALAGEDLQRGGLAGAVAADQADPVAGLHAQGGVGRAGSGRRRAAPGRWR